MVLSARRLARIPHAPGVYVFTRRGTPIYVGKAADLRDRLRAYQPERGPKPAGWRFGGGAVRASPTATSSEGAAPVERERERALRGAGSGGGYPKGEESPFGAKRGWKQEMLRAATGLTVEVAGSEIEAFLLEANWIKAHQPKYNVANRDQKNFLAIVITDEEFPQVLATRSFDRPGAAFGPFTSAYAVRETLRALRKIFPFRCSRPPSFLLAGAPAEVGDSPVRGRERGPARRARSDRSVALPPAAGTMPAPVALRPAGRAPLPAGAHRARPCLYFHLGLCAGTCAGMISAEEYRARVVQPLRRVLEGHVRNVRAKLDLEHRALLDDVLQHTRVLAVTEKYAADLRDLQRVLGLPRPPRRIEGYDISNIHGIEAVGSMVVAVDGEPTLSEYKRFKIRTLEGQSNDVGMLREVLIRRFAHSTLAGPAAGHPRRARALRAGTPNGPGARGLASLDIAPPVSPARSQAGGSSLRLDPPTGVTRSRIAKQEGSWEDPDLILVDGGRPQLNAALRAMRRSGAAFPVIALAKRLEEIYIPDRAAPLRLPQNAPALHLLQRIRDEAHRFAVSYHRFRRAKRMLS